MTTAHRRLLPALLLLALAAPLLAEGEQHLVALVRATRAAPGKGMIAALLGGLADLPGLDLEGGRLRAALRGAGLPPHPVADRFLDPIARLNKSGSKLELRYPSPVQVEVVVGGKPRGWVTLERQVSFRAERREGRLLLDDIKGIKLSRSREGFQVSLKRIQVLTEAGRPVAKVTAGLVWPLEKTRTIDLSDPLKAADDAARPESASEGPGIAGALR